MKLIKNINTNTYHEIEIEKKFLFWKWNVKYRKLNDHIFRFKEPNNYFTSGFLEQLKIQPLFYAPVNTNLEPIQNTEQKISDSPIRKLALKVLNEYFKHEGKLGHLEDRQVKLVLDAMIDFQLNSFNIPSKDESVNVGFRKATIEVFKHRKVCKEPDQDIYYTGWMDCYDWLVKKNNGV